MFKNFVLHRSWLVVGVMLALVLFVRMRLREMPLERDEGEYAYAGQLMLQGIPPYKLAYNMKLPGTYAAYAVIMAVFGQTPAGIHTGLALVNCASIILVYLIGRKLLDETTGLVAAIAFGLMSLSPSVFGLAAHATHFVTFFALAGTLALMKSVECQVSRGSDFNAKSAKGAEERREDHRPSTLNPQPSEQPQTPMNRERVDADEHRYKTADFNAEGAKNAEKRKENSVTSSESRSRFGVQSSRFKVLASIFHPPSPIFYIAASGAMYGFAFLMKQHGVFFGIFGFVYLVVSQWSVVRGPSSPRRRSASRITLRAPRPTIDYSQLTIHALLFATAFLTPYVLTCLILWASGVFPQFWFWTVSYAGKYATAVPIIYGADVLKTALDVVIGPYTFFWLLAAAGAVWMWWDERFAEASVQSSVFSLQSSKVELPQKGAKEREKRRSQFNAESAKGAEKRREDPQPPEQPQTPMNRERVNADEHTFETAKYAKYAKAESTGIQPPSTTPDSALGSRITHYASRNAPEHAESSKIAQPRIMLAMFTVCSFASVSVGFHYRNHYFITLLPAIGLLAGVAVSRAIYLLPRTKSLDLFLALPVPLIALGGVIWSLAGDGALWFATPVSQADIAVYKTTAFREASNIAKFIRAQLSTPHSQPSEQPQMDADKRRSDTRHVTPDTQLFNAETAKDSETHREDSETAKYSKYAKTDSGSIQHSEFNAESAKTAEARKENSVYSVNSCEIPVLNSAVRSPHSALGSVAVIGSEPEIYFLARLPSATGYIYTFPLMEYQSMAETMQRQMIAEIETNKPEYVIYVADDLSWLRRPDSLRLIDDWWKGYWDKNLELVDTITIKEQRIVNMIDKTVGLTPATNPDGSPKCFLVLKRN